MNSAVEDWNLPIAALSAITRPSSPTIRSYHDHRISKKRENQPTVDGI